MSKGRMNLKDISDVKVADDGNEAQLTFNGKNNQSLTVLLSFDQAEALTETAIKIMEEARFNRGAHSDMPKSFSPLRDVLLVKTLELLVNPDGSLDFLINTPDGRSFQVSIPAHYGVMLRDVFKGDGGQHQLG